MIDLPQAAIIAVVLFGSTLIRSTFGFGDAVVAMPLLALFLDLRLATPLVALVAITLALLITVDSWRDIRLDGAGRLLAGSLAGVPLGMFLLKGGHPIAMQIVLGVVVAGFALFRMRGLSARLQVGQRSALGFGLVAGVLGGAYNTNGPPVVIYATLRRWPPRAFRATLQGYFLVTGAVIVLGHGAVGLWSAEVWRLYGIALPGALVALWLGRRWNRRFPVQRFEQAVNWLLLLLGVALLARAWFS